MSTVYQELADTKKSEIQKKVEQVNEISTKVDVLDAEIRQLHEEMRQKNHERSELSAKARRILGEITA